ncbi:hypothetical protein SDC9_178455 [bioreactor metagenome]|uniref:Uncharacterized protein n=1 Tax=bioreactor metagenome TaxID=1076179 RepID=A0A645H3T7_9ZZZZ
MCGSGPLVDIHAIGSAAYGHHFGPEFMQDHGRYLIGRTMAGIDHDLQSSQGECMVASALAKLDIATGGVFQELGLSECDRRDPMRLIEQHLLDCYLPDVGQLGAFGTEEFDAVVLEGVVAGADDHSQAGPQGPREIGHPRCRQRPKQHHIRARGIEARHQGAFEHMPRDARVLANQHRRALFVAMKHSSGGNTAEISL